VDGGLNREHKPIGFVNWTIGNAPFVGGLSGFATVFIAAAMSCEFFKTVRAYGQTL
jgi:AAT family amino acid transporter